MLLASCLRGHLLIETIRGHTSHAVSSSLVNHVSAARRLCTASASSSSAGQITARPSNSLGGWRSTPVQVVMRFIDGKAGK
ncbi:hypothetical protein [Oryza sativa Japonica Group]|uniref:Uncharacterized protein n=1 Tax=Oryza sativa subsp. japonica TaxID=39947 RepID=Q5QLT8_ORYSJ|nr:hypothetical protein [Oryza sativa Japonica Group]BAD81845.1 hypothetical protein [Oryza sativa Japonica Group]